MTSYVSAEIIGHSLILTDISGNTTDINLLIAEVRKTGDSFIVQSLRTKSKPIPFDNTLVGGDPLTYEDVREVIESSTLFGSAELNNLFENVFSDLFGELTEFDPLFEIDEVV